MSKIKNWFVHVGGEIFGPVSTEIITVMVRQNRLQFSDFIWYSGLTKWVRILDVDDFVGLLPPYPQVSIPTSSQKILPTENLSIPKPIASKYTEKIIPAEEINPRSGSVSGNPSKPGTKLAAFQRAIINGKVKMSGKEPFQIVDISEGGVFVATAELLEIGTEIAFTLEADALGKPLPMVGVVIRHGERKDQSGFAIEFMRVNPIYKRIIQTYISEHQEAS